MIKKTNNIKRTNFTYSFISNFNRRIVFSYCIIRVLLNSVRGDFYVKRHNSAVHIEIHYMPFSTLLLEKISNIFTKNISYNV